MTENEKKTLVDKCDNAIHGMCTTAFKPYLCRDISREINSMPTTPSIDEILDKITAEIEEKISHYGHFENSNTANGLRIAKQIVEKYKGDSEC